MLLLEVLKLNKLLLFLVVLLFLPVVLGSNSYEVGNFSLIVPCIDEFDDYCSNSTVCTLTVLDANKQVIVDNENMTWNVQHFTFDFNDSMVVGEYESQVLCVGVDGGAGFSNDVFEVRSTNKGVIGFGFCPNDSRGYFLLSLFGVLLVFMTVVGVGIIKVGLFDLMVAFGWIIYGLFLLPCNWLLCGLSVMFAVGIVINVIVGSVNK